MDVHKDKTDIIAELLLDRKIGILPTDTIYGIHCLWTNDELKRRISGLKKREAPFIVIIPQGYSLDKLGVVETAFTKAQTAKFWPGPNTLVFPTTTGETLALRTPDNSFLQQILTKTGPLVSTSANLHTQPSAVSIDEAKNTFGDKIDFYVDAGPLPGKASNIYKLDNETITKLR